MGEKDAIYYLPLYKAALQGDWSAAKKFFDEDPEALDAKISTDEETALHVAIASGRSITFVKNLVDLMAKQGKPFDSKSDFDHETPLHYAAEANNVEAAKLLVSKDPSLHMIKTDDNFTPLLLAAAWGHRDVTWFLYSLIKDESHTDFDAVLLLNLLIYDDFYDIAIILVKRYPVIVLEEDTMGRNALSQLARKPHVFPSGSQLAYWQRILYNIIPSPAKYEHKNSKGGDIENLAGQKSETNLEEYKGGHYYGFLKEIHYSKIKHNQALELLRFLISEAIKSKAEKANELLGRSSMLAVRYGNYELVTEVVKAYPSVVWLHDDDWHNIFDVAVIYRQEKVYNLLYRMGSWKYFTMGFDKNYNTILHLAAKLESPSRINKISGAALQMQRELQWYKEVEQLVQPSYRESKNEDDKVPATLFSETHKSLCEQGEKWMKDTATSCTIVAALVVTIVFVAAFTVPGNSNSSNFMNDTDYMLFVIANAFALFSSSASVLMFLGMLTSRYSGEDFLMALPMRLAIGLITLFFSIASMLVAFSAGLYMVLAHQVHWIGVPIGLLASLPVILFALLQFPLLVEIVSSTFGPSIFGKKTDQLLMYS